MYRILAHRLGIGAHVTFTGAVPYERASTHLALGDLAVAPKLSLTEGNGKLVNYMAMGLPVVAYDSPVNREMLGALGIYAPRGDWSALAIELEQALVDLPATRERGRALRAKAIAEHGWEASARLLLEVYGRALGKEKAAHL
jgi:glycosyltransferase involved in cell wall biosynthesis